MDNHTYIIIGEKHYLTLKKKFLFANSEEFMESVQKYFERNGIPFTWNREGVKAMVSDRFQVHEICTHFGLHDIELFEDNKTTVLY